MKFIYGIVIVIYNFPITKIREMVSFFEYIGSPVVLVNNGVKLDFAGNKNVHVINLKKNMGIAYAQNKGVSFLESKFSIELVFFIDQDSIVDTDFFNNMIKVWREIENVDSKISLLSPQIFNIGTSSFDSVPVIKQKKIEYFNFDTSISFIKNVLPISSGSLVSVRIFDFVGKNNERLFIDCVDFDLALKLISLGYGVYSTNKCVLKQTIGNTRQVTIFKKHFSVSNHQPFRDYYAVRNTVYLFRNYKNFFPQLPALLGYFLKIQILSVPFEKNRIKRTFFIIKGFIDGFTKKLDVN
ncbi:glycosyltransferase [Liquorilactobacillus sicerae]|uniref:glycosyltransferase n=1 Tax=Liquorilactobacillus sicerae TaxID=1416943 RepID=UPI0024808273|nr:glycosyltransferase [Liquorilactobacillus sicerae]